MTTETSTDLPSNAAALVDPLAIFSGTTSTGDDEGDQPLPRRRTSRIDTTIAPRSSQDRPVLSRRRGGRTPAPLTQRLNQVRLPGGQRVQIDERDLFIPSSDRGGTEKISLRLRSLDFRRADVYMEHADATFETKSDLLRCAIHIGLSMLESADPRKGIFQMAHMLSDLAIKAAETQKFEEAIESLQAVVNQDIKNGCMGAARNNVLRALRVVKEFDPQYQDLYGKQIEDRFGFLLETDVVSMNPTAMDEALQSDEVEIGEFEWGQDEDLVEGGS